ncbi:TetR/AcrR family transcriptional regulator [Amycolatopsis acidicola]|uniref:TetR/AcrR family transcriptional regulator n=1 Tax=Amycolatopsis acidicola TaxID=2596893 RepID=A0A5N0UWX9_9PSEU|nr:TetR/AcrR family transcriptional regulator [Amycolatopsis acidicola]KAA9155412.1 TetR/AcrR family transcriptional regulator [Amycolatopsis acidicola]
MDERRLQPRKQPRQVRAELTRQRILDAAAHVFTEHGYAAVTTNRIAERARISIGSLYQYFPNKDAILLELLTRHLAEGRTALEDLRDRELPRSLEDLLRLFVRASIENHRDDPELLRLMMERAPGPTALVDQITSYQQAEVDYFRALFENHPEVRVADVETATRLVIALMHFVVHPLIASPRPADPVRLENEIVAMLTRYLTGRH